MGDASLTHPTAVSASGNAQQGVGNHCGKQLQADGIMVVAKELPDPQMLLYPAE
jgi:hypothetical protein